MVSAGNPSGSFHSPPPFTQGRLLVGAMPKARRNYVVVCAGNPSVSLAADSLSLRLGHGAALICHRHIIHYRAATSLPLTQGSLWLGVASTTLSSKSRPGGRQEGRYCRSARYCSSRASSWAAVSARMALGSAARSSAGVRLPQVISTVGRPRFLPREISTWESPT